MKSYLNEVPLFVDTIRQIREIVIVNIILIGQIPAPTFQEEDRAAFLLDRMAEFQVDECSTDSYGNPFGIIRGTSPGKPPIFVVAHLDTILDKDADHNFTVTENSIAGPGILDNSTSVGVLASLPEIFRRTGLCFESDIVLAGVIQSIGKGNLGGIRHLVKTWPGPVRGAVCLESGELGRLNYYSDGMIRCEVESNIPRADGWGHKFKPNAILTLNEIINEILKMPLPQRPRARVIIGKILGGYKHGIIAQNANLGFEIQSKSDKMVKKIFSDIKDIVNGYSHEYEVDLKLRVISSQKAARLKYNHPLVKSVVAVMKKLNLKPTSEPSESELSVFLSRDIPAVTLGITHGNNFHHKNAMIEIEPMFRGIAQILGVLMAIDRGACDE